MTDASSDKNSRWRRIEPTTSIQGHFRTIVEKTFQAPDGNEYIMSTIHPEHSHGAAVIALTADNRAVIAYQYRPGPQRMMQELPGGGVDAGEDPEAAAKRELLEETGYKVGTIEHLGSFCRDGYNNSRFHYYLARNCHLTGHGQNLDDGEFITVKTITIEELISAALTDQMTDPVAVFYALEQLRAIQDEGQ